jgi:replicative DNA helicase
MSVDPSRLPPQNVEIEKGVLGALILDEQAFREVSPDLKVEHFYRDIHQIVYRVLCEIHDEGKPVDLAILEEELRSRELLEKIGGFPALAEIVSSSPHSANVFYHVQIIKEKALARDVIAACSETLDEGYSNILNASDLLSKAEERIFAIGEAEAKGGTREIGRFALEAMGRFASRKGGEYSGVATGLVRLDNLTDGLTNAQFIILAARPSLGKTALALNVAEHAAINSGVGTLFISLEMAGIELAERLIVARSGVDGYKYKTGQYLDSDEEERIGVAYGDLRACRKLWIDDTPIRTIGQIAANARRHKARHGIGLMILDYVQLIDSGREMARNASRQEQVGAISRRLKTLAKELNIPLLVLSQLNRNSESREDRKPRLSDLRESGSLEQDADMVFLLHRPDFYDPGDSPGLAEVIVGKNRNGKTGTVKLTYHKEITRFVDFVEPKEAVPAELQDGESF